MSDINEDAAMCNAAEVLARHAAGRRARRSGGMTSKLQQLIELHGSLLEQNPYCYFELAYTKATGWMAWICTNHLEADPFRKVLARGQGESPEEAADAALESFHSAKHQDTEPVRAIQPAV